MRARVGHEHLSSPTRNQTACNVLEEAAAAHPERREFLVSIRDSLRLLHELVSDLRTGQPNTSAVRLAKVDYLLHEASRQLGASPRPPTDTPLGALDRVVTWSIADLQNATFRLARIPSSKRPWIDFGIAQDNIRVAIERLLHYSIPRDSPGHE